MVILWGIPGSGKSTFARWLRDNRAFHYLETDRLAHPGGRRSTLERAWLGLIADQRSTSPEEFIEVADGAGVPVVVEYGLWTRQGPIDLLHKLRDLGAIALWFDGDRGAAKQAWLSENVRAPRPWFVDDDWNRVVDVIDQNWDLVQAFFGASIIRTIESGPTYIPPEDIYAAAFDRR